MNSFGHLFRINIFGESHGPGVGIVVDGLPAGLQLEVADFNADLSRRRAGAKGTTPRKEADLPRLVNGVFNNFTTGAPLLIQFENTNTRSADYDKLREMPRPGHADFVASKNLAVLKIFVVGSFLCPHHSWSGSCRGSGQKLLSQVSISAKLIEAGGNADVDAAVDRALEEQDSIGALSNAG